MKEETKTIIKGICGTVLLVILALFTIYNAYKIKSFNDNLRDYQMVFKENENTENHNNNDKNNYNLDNNTNKVENNNNQNTTTDNNNNITINYDKQTARTVTIYVFKGDGCPHCAHALEFFKDILNDYNLEIQTFEVWKNPNNKSLMQEVAKEITTENINSIPFIVFENGEYFTGFSNSISNKIKEKIISLSKENTTNIVKNIIDNYSLETNSEILKKG